ncbi:MAG TPA: ATP-binding protein [Acidimicrobiia bacterium]|nr:ATP-binding protein [Acidimicrobiia bacterium]
MSVEAYDPIANPYAPGAGTPPPELVGRDRVIEEAEVAMRRVVSARTSQHQLITGLRGVGKTVLLGKLTALAEHIGFRVVRVEAVGGDDTLRSLLRQARLVVEDIDRSGAMRALRSIESVSLTVAGTGLSVDRFETTPDREALSDVIVEMARIAQSHDVGIMVAIDEAQMVDAHDLRRILAGVHRCNQDGLPLFIALAGLPNLVGVVASASTYAERMFRVTELGPLTPDQVAQAVNLPAEELGVAWSPRATEAIVDRSDGYPFFVQTWAYHTWNAAHDDPISVDDVERATPNASSALDSSFFAARTARIPASEVSYVQALASLGPGPHRSGDVAKAAGRTTSQVAAFRDRLIREGLIYAPRYGWVEFAIPHFDAYARRALPDG